MKLKFYFSLLLFCILVIPTEAQIYRPDSNNWGDVAPPLRVSKWIKGNSVRNFEKGKIYVLEFWASWCAPCMAAMPSLSVLAHKYKNEVTVVAIDIYEQKTTPINNIEALVDSLGDRMNFNVAIADTDFTGHDWFEEKFYSLPRTVVVNAQGKVAWVGQPSVLHTVLPKVLKNTWNITQANQAAIQQQKLSDYLGSIEEEAGEKFAKYEGKYYTRDDLGSPDSALLLINELVAKEPGLKYAPIIAAFTFTALLKTDPKKAYEYGQELLATPSYDGQLSFGAIIGGIKDYLYKIDVPPEIYKLGADAYRIKIDQSPYPELFDNPDVYLRIANWYWLGGDKRKAMKARRKAKSLLKKDKSQLSHFYN